MLQVSHKWHLKCHLCGTCNAIYVTLVLLGKMHAFYLLLVFFFFLNDAFYLLASQNGI